MRLLGMLSYDLLKKLFGKALLSVLMRPCDGHGKRSKTDRPLYVLTLKRGFRFSFLGNAFYLRLFMFA